MFTIRSTVDTTTQHTPSQLVFSRVVILNINQEANWQSIIQHKQALINKGIQKQNHCRQSHVDRTGDKVLLKNKWKTKLNYDTCVGPYTMTAVQNNGTVYTRRGKVADTYNLRNINSFKEQVWLPLWGSMSKASVSPRIIKYHMNYLITIDDVNTHSWHCHI